MNIRNMKWSVGTDFAISMLCIALAATSTSAFAQNAASAQDEKPLPPYYRVELIVFSHVNGQSDAYRSPELTDYRNVLDPLQLAEAQKAAAEALAKFQNLVPTIPSNRTGNQTTLSTKNTLKKNPMPEPYLAQAELSERMQTVLDRLDRSAQYQPISWRTWYQTAQRAEATYWVRMHDQEPIKQPAQQNRSDFNQPDHYRLDGQARLHQRQFLHLYFDLEWREAAGRPAPMLSPGSSLDQPRIATEALPTEWNVHRFDQSRIVRVDRIEYFDSGWLGVVALLTRIEPPKPSGEMPLTIKN